MTSRTKFINLINSIKLVSDSLVVLLRSILEFKGSSDFTAEEWDEISSLLEHVSTFIKKILNVHSSKS